MMKTISNQDIQAAIIRVANRLLEITDLLNHLDAAMGDGDTGVSVTKGANGVLEYIAANPVTDDLGKWLANVGMTYNRHAPSTMGALVATALMRAGKEVMQRPSLEMPDLSKMLVAAATGIMERGKAKIGDKTLLDALYPAAVAFGTAAENGADLETAGMAMIQAARDGRDAATPLKSMVGRANWVGGTEGKQDPGTVLVVTLLEALMDVEEG